MRIVLFCENKYAIDILHPIQLEADREGGNEVLWYVHEKKIPDFPLKCVGRRAYKRLMTSCPKPSLCLETLFPTTFLV